MSRNNTCPHPDRLHYAKGKCRQCYFADRNKGHSKVTIQESSDVALQREAWERALERAKNARLELAEAENLVEFHRARLEAATAQEREEALRRSAENLVPYFNRLIARERLDKDPKWARDKHGERANGYWAAVEALGPLVERPAILPPLDLTRATYERETARWCAETGHVVTGVSEDGSLLFSNGVVEP